MTAQETAPTVAEDLVLEASGMSAGYGDVDVIRDINLSVRRGEVVALLGPNGAGKTTTLAALGGMIPVRRGQVSHEGRVTRAPLHVRSRNGLSLIPEQGTVCNLLNVSENIRVAGCDPDEAYSMFPELVDLKRRRGGLLSGGEQRMLSLACALARDPSLVMADELSLGLAPLLVRRLLGILRAAGDRGVGVLIVEQHVRQVLRFADRAYILRRGEVVLEGRASSLLARIDELEEAYLSSSQEPADGRKQQQEVRRQ